MFDSPRKSAVPASAKPGTPAVQPWGDIYTMPETFRPVPKKPRASGGTKWLIVALAVVVVAAVGVGLFLVLRAKPQSQPEPQPPVAVTPTPEPTPTPTLPTQSPEERDRTRYRDVRQIQAALELYFADANQYPVMPLPVALGTTSTAVLSSGGFAAEAQGTVYLSPVPQNPEPGGTPYLYVSLDGTTYTLAFRLEAGTAGLSATDHQATPQGIDGLSSATPSNPLTPRTVQPPATTLDTDQDGLTDAEEPSWGADPAKPDTDGDGYLDGAELAQGYDPAQGSGALLAASQALSSYQNSKFGYTVYYPKTWAKQEVDPETSQVTFSPPSDSGEFIEVLVVGNPDGLTAQAWYAKQAGNLTAAEVPTRSVGTLTWALSLDGLNAYLATGTNIIAVSLNMATRADTSYYATWQAMVSMFMPPAAANVSSPTLPATPLPTGLPLTPSSSGTSGDTTLPPSLPAPYGNP